MLQVVRQRLSFQLVIISCAAISIMLLMCGIPRYAPPYGTMVRPVYPPRLPGAINVLPVSRPPVAGIPPLRPIIPPVVRPVVPPSVTPAEKQHTTVYIGKIAPTVENEFMLSLLK
ncbi:RNA-binding protein 25-like, partial [Trifolium medium]|nr:RNA-binding protein 25-like [Trifolium medium]